MNFFFPLRSRDETFAIHKIVMDIRLCLGQILDIYLITHSSSEEKLNISPSFPVFLFDSYK